MAIATPADRPKSVRNRCVIEVFCGVLCVVTLLFGFFCQCEGFCHRAESDLFLFSFHITNFPFLSSNIPSSPAYGVFISQLIRYARACSSYDCFILRAARLSSKLLGQGYVMERLKSSLGKFYGRYGDLIKHYEVPSPKCYRTFWDMVIYSDTLN